jgi:hypothetical protein
VGLEEERYEPADWIYMARDGCRLAVLLTLLNLSEQCATQVIEDFSCWSHIGMFLHPAFSIPAIAIQGNFIVLFLRSLSVRSVRHDTIVAVYEAMK